MKNWIKTVARVFIFFVFTSIVFSLKAQVGINTNNPDASAVLDLNSPDGNQGLLVPRVSDLSNIQNPANGLMVFNVTDHTYYCYIAAQTGWFALNPLNRANGSSDIKVPAGNNLVVDQGNVTLTNGNIVAGSGTVTATSFVGHGTIPVGGIIMWTGTTIPDDSWVLCMGGIVNDNASPINGSSIPDLRGRFIVGYDNATSDYNTISKTGGDARVGLKISELPPHQHEANGAGANISINDGGAHIHIIQGQRGGDNDDHNNTEALAGADKTPSEIGFNFNFVTLIDNNNGNHSHINSEFSGLVGNGSTQGLSAATHENRPPYYVLAFIMRIK